MFAKTAKYRLISPRQAARDRVAFAHSNDNTAIARAAGAPHGIRRATLVCRWQRAIAGGLECHWDIEAANGTATEDADQRCISVYGRLRPTLSLGGQARRPRSSNAARAGETPAVPGESVGRGLATGRHVMPAAG
jgi:hypothetical protein